MGRTASLTGRSIRTAMLALLCAGIRAAAAPAPVAPRPPMGWNSWDAYGFTITEAQFRANVRVLATLKPFGWDTAVIDEGWYMADPLGVDVPARKYQLDSFGRLVPDVQRFPTAAHDAGLKALATWTHAQGLKFGIHIVRGIPRAAVDANLPIAGTRFRAADAADKAAVCPWDQGNYGIADNAAGQAYYDALIRQYAGWGVDFLKVDCISDHPYRPTEIRQIGVAIRKAGRPMVLSLSPGPSQVENGPEMARSAEMWRIADDLWDGWSFLPAKWPNGVLTAFDNLAAWVGHTPPGTWADADMLPFGSLRPHPGWGDPRQSRLTPAETRTAMTLFAIARSPLILGANLTALDPATRALVTNRAVIALDQEDREAMPMPVPPITDRRIWLSGRRGRGAPDTMAVFNLSDAPIRFVPGFAAVAGGGTACDLWSGQAIAASDLPGRVIAPHDVLLLRLRAGDRCSSSSHHSATKSSFGSTGTRR